jgi:hypothetical protein
MDAIVHAIGVKLCCSGAIAAHCSTNMLIESVLTKYNLLQLSSSQLFVCDIKVVLSNFNDESNGMIDMKQGQLRVWIAGVNSAQNCTELEIRLSVTVSRSGTRRFYRRS